MTSITIERLEKAINDCRRIHPPVDYVLGPDLRKLAAIWGEMIANKQTTLEVETQTGKRLDVLRKWLGAAAGQEPVAAKDADAGRACPMGTDDAGECEACQ